MADLAEAYPDEDWLRPPADETAEAVVHEPWHALYWRAWDALRFERTYGAMGGQGPISWRALRDYARDLGLDDDDRDVFERLMRALDEEWLGWVAEQEAQRKRAQEQINARAR